MTETSSVDLTLNTQSSVSSTGAKTLCNSQDFKLLQNNTGKTPQDQADQRYLKRIATQDIFAEKATVGGKKLMSQRNKPTD